MDKKKDMMPNMDMSDEEIMNKLREAAEDIEVPESLKPENIKAMLDQQVKTENGTVDSTLVKDSNDTENRGGKVISGSRLWTKRLARLTEVAAVLTVTFVAGYQLRDAKTPKSMDTAIVEMTEMETTEIGDAVGGSALEPETKDVPKSIMDSEMTVGETDVAESIMESELTVGETDAAESIMEPVMMASVNDQMEMEVDDDEDTAGESAETMQEQSVEKSEQIAAGTESVTDIIPDGFVVMNTRKDLYSKLRSYETEEKLLRWLTGGSIKYASNVVYDTDVVYEDYDAEMDIAPVGAAKAVENTGSLTQDFSTTNLRSMGVDEGDIVKTDGSYIYILKKSGMVSIVDVRDKEPKLISTIMPEALEEVILDMYLTENGLQLITSGEHSSLQSAEKDVYEVVDYQYVCVTTYDISDRSNPIVLGSTTQEGRYLTTRKVGDYIYLFTKYDADLEDEEADSRVVPLINEEEMDVDDIYLPEHLGQMSYLVMTSVNVNDPARIVDTKAVVAGAEHFYVSSESIYLYSESWMLDQDRTKIVKFHYEDGLITGVGAGQVKGYLNDSFSLDEYDGHLRVVSTIWDGKNINQLYVFDEKMELVGKIEHIAENETIRSARFMGEIGYFVTFRQTDPLFSVDLSDPKNPQIIGELKITGFSEYLHPYGEGQLLGIGYEADPETGWTNGIKLSMFDTSDPTNVKECNKYVIKDAYYCPCLDNYKAVMIDPVKNLFGFVCDEDYLVFSYDPEKGFVNELSYRLDSDHMYANYEERGVYIGDAFYLADADRVLYFDMAENYKLKAKEIL